jgi:hypothetical protein
MLSGEASAETEIVRASDAGGEQTPKSSPAPQDPSEGVGPGADTEVGSPQH